MWKKNVSVTAGTLRDLFKTSLNQCVVDYFVINWYIGLPAHFISNTSSHYIWCQTSLTSALFTLDCLYVATLKDHYCRRVQEGSFSLPYVSSLPPDYWIIYLFFKLTCPKLRLLWLFFIILEQAFEYKEVTLIIYVLY